MFTRIMITLGWIGLACAIGYFIVADKMKAHTDYIHRTQQIMIVSAGLIVGGYVLKFIGGIAGVGSGRCKKCGKRIAKSEMFCFDHQKEIIWESKEKTREVGFKNRLQ